MEGEVEEEAFEEEAMSFWFKMCDAIDYVRYGLFL
jgi:hypothetical protein